MSHLLPPRSFLTFSALFLAFVSPALGQQSGSRPGEKKSKPQLRFICATSLAEEQAIVLASSDEKGALVELGTVTLRTSLVSDWMPAKVGDLHLARREEKILKSIGHFQYPADTTRALVVLNANVEKNTYEATVVDPEKTGFIKGSVLIINFSPRDGLVSLGSKENKVEAGQQVLAMPTLDGNGMYPLVASYLDADAKTVPCYDRLVSGNPNSRSVLFLLPDEAVGLRILSLTIFGELK
jgi:hypothetical protein